MRRIFLGLMPPLLLVLLAACGGGAGSPPGGTQPGGAYGGSLPGAPGGTQPGQAEGRPPALALTKLVDGLARPVYLTHAGDGSGRLYVLEQPGRVRVIEGGKLQGDPFLDLTDRINSRSNEQGLLGLAFHPAYRENGALFVHYTGSGGETVIARYRRSAGSPLKADPASGETLLTVEQPFPNHNGGSILFGPDGHLYIALGDGGSAGDPGNRAQNLESLLGKILRVAVGPDGPATIPPGNPFAGRPGRDEIWAYGLRNPWRISFDRGTGDLYIADVGQNAVEEINWQPAASRGGENYGWKLFEGGKRYSQGELTAHAEPVAQYTHADGCSVTGGYVYRGADLPGLVGWYLYGDYCKGTLWGLRQEGAEWRVIQLLKSGLTIASFGEDEAGELYVVDHRGGLFRLIAAP